ncbi:MAG: TonB-dependent receptor [Gammaproteobacteria bacterium]|nr:TonB-dependent receptor [Gammaproteobacteria bacterium]
MRGLRSRVPHPFAAALTLVVGLSFGIEAWAQIEEIIVTARKREENLQEVPVAVSAFTAADLQKLNIRDVADITKYESSLIFTQGFAAQDTRITIRGLAPTRGRQNVAVLVDDIDISNQPFLTNGSGLLLNPRLFDTERVEVVKGPQNALYGRTAFAGAVNYITRKPSNELEGRVATDFGSQGNVDVRAGISGPLVDGVLYGGVNVAGWQNDGFYSNSITGGDVGGTEGYGLSGTLIWNATDNFSARVRLEYTDDEFDQAPYFADAPTVPKPVPPSALGTVISPNVTSILTAGDIPKGSSSPVTLWPDPRTGADYPGVDRESTRGTLTLDWDLGAVSLKSLTHYADSEVFSYEDARRTGTLDPTSVEGTARGEFWGLDKNELLSQELRIQSETDKAVSWTAGLLYWEENTDYFDGGVNCIQVAAFGPPLDCAAPIASLFPTDASRLADLWERDTEHWSVYGLIEWEFVDDWLLSFEGRYTDEELTTTGPDRGNDPNGAAAGGAPPRPRAFDSRGMNPQFPPTILPAYGQISDKVSDDFFAPKATLQWNATEDSLLYLSFAKAFKPAGISIVAVLSGYNRDVSRFEQEELDVYEFGAKTSWLDNRLVVNGTVFYQDFTDKQTSSQQVTASGLLAAVPVNASAAEVSGIELDAAWQATDHLNLYMSYTYLDTEYKDFKTNQSGISRIVDAGNCTVVTVGGSTLCELDLSGRELEYAPENSLIAGLSYRRPLVGDTDWFFETDFIFQDERWQDNANTVRIDSYEIVDFRFGFANDQWEVLAYMNNAFEDDTVQSTLNNTDNANLGFDFGPPFTLLLLTNQIPIKPDERSYGVRIAYNFGAN